MDTLTHKGGTEDTSDEGVDGDSAVRVEAIAINNVVQALPESYHATTTHQS